MSNYDEWKLYQSYNTYPEFLVDLIKETNKFISLVPKDNDVSQYQYDIVLTLHNLKEIYEENKQLKHKLKLAKEEKKC